MCFLRKYQWLIIFLVPFYAQAIDVNYCVDPDWMPYEAMVNGQHKGISKEYKQLFQENSTINFNRIPAKSWNEVTEFLKAGKCELTLMLNRSSEREQYLDFTMPYFFGPNVLVTTNNRPYVQNISAAAGMKIGVVKGYRLVSYMERFHPNLQVTLLDSELNGLLAVADGEIDVYVGSLLSITSKLKQHNIANLKINGWVAIQDELRVGVIKSRSAELLPILNKVIDQIPVQVHNDILNRWSNTLVVTETDYTLVRMITLGAVLLLLILGWRFQISRKVTATLTKKNAQLQKMSAKLEESNRQLEYISYHDNLTGLYNRHYFLTTFNHLFNDMQRQSHDASLMLIDIDFFKQINDKYGHNAGDEALTHLGKLLKKAIRSGDVPARWGGEEFVVLMPSTTENDVKQVAERLIQNIESYQFPIIAKLTVSIGVSQFRADDTIKTWLERTDKALYQAKEQGRNRIRYSA
ncbi:diguanylate cyclase [Psychrosphaera sp. 1_MG-2023]|nr:diguanylate cyclase [Psychrosphaera sp. 1_MG-2023]MDO6719798.1 diguanylate cyclase [Psychrosphaera sp. 1_MG-2023]